MTNNSATMIGQVKIFMSFIVIVLTYTAAYSKSNDTLSYRHSFQFNVAGLSFERWGLVYEMRITPQHALSAQVGGSYWGISEEKEYGFGLHYKYFFQPVNEAKFLWLFKSSYKNTFGDINVRYMNLAEGIYNGAKSSFKSYYLGVGIGQTWVWNDGFTISDWLGYGPPIGAQYRWKNTVPEGGESWAKMYKWTSGLDFGLSIGYSF